MSQGWCLLVLLNNTNFEGKDKTYCVILKPTMNWFMHPSSARSLLYKARNTSSSLMSLGRFMCKVFACLVQSTASLCKRFLTKSIAHSWCLGVLCMRLSCNRYPEPKVSLRYCCVPITFSFPSATMAIQLQSVPQSQASTHPRHSSATRI